MPRGVNPKPSHVPRAHTCPVHVLTIVCIELLVRQQQPSRSISDLSAQSPEERGPSNNWVDTTPPIARSI